MPNKPSGAPKDKGNLELAYQQLDMTIMNVDEVVATTLVDENTPAEDVDGHEWGNSREGDGEDSDHEDDYEEGEWEDNEEDTDDADNGDMILESDDDDDGDMSPTN